MHYWNQSIGSTEKMLACFYILAGVEVKEDDQPNGDLQKQIASLLWRPKDEELTGSTTSITSLYRRFFLLQNAARKASQIP
jgi:hypothetical protein